MDLASLIAQYGILGLVVLGLVRYILWKEQKNEAKETLRDENFYNKLLLEVKQPIDSVKQFTPNAHNECILGFDIEAEFRQMQTDISDLFIALKQTETELALEKRYEALLRNRLSYAIPFFKNKQVLQFSIRSCLVVIEFILDVKDLIFKSKDHLQLGLQSIDMMVTDCRVRAQDWVSEGLSEAASDSFECRANEMKKRIVSVFEDTVNNKVDRFVSYGSLFLQEFLSDMSSSYHKFADSGKIDLVEEVDSSDGLKTLRSETTKLNQQGVGSWGFRREMAKLDRHLEEEEA